MSIKACIKLISEANEATRANFVEAIERLSARFESGLSTRKILLRPRKVSQDERVYPISIIGWENGSDNAIWFEIHDKGYITHFKSLAILEMESRGVGDKYEVIVDP